MYIVNMFALLPLNAEGAKKKKVITAYALFYSLNLNSQQVTVL